MRGFSFQPPIEASIAFLASIGFFLLTAAIPIRGDVVPIVLLGCVYVYVVVLAARWGGPLYAVPLAIAGGLGFDSFYIPPTREFGASHWQNWLVVFIYISMGLLIGVLGSHAQRRAEASERARGRLADVRPRCAGSRHWWQRGRRQKGCSTQLRAKSDSCSAWTPRSCAAASWTAR